MEQTTILNELEREGYVVIPIKGVSMLPLLHQESSHVLIRRLDGRPKVNDVLLYVRPDGKQVLHRLIRYDGDVCLIRGDNTFGLERVPLSDVKGVMETVWRGKGVTFLKSRHFRGHDMNEHGEQAERGIQTTDFIYRLYVWFWNLIYPLRLLKHQAKAGIGKRIRKLGRRLISDTSLAWIVKMVQGELWGILLLTLCTGATAFLSVILALVMRNAIDFAVSGTQTEFLHWVGVFLGIIVAQLVLRAIIRQEDERLRASIENRLKVHTYDNVLRSGYSGLKAFHTGELQNRLTNDVRVVAGDATALIPGVCSMSVQLVCALVILMMLDWRFGSLFLVGGLMMLGVTFSFRRRMKSLHKEVQETDGRLRSWMQESVESILIVKSFEAEGQAAELTRQKADVHKRARMKSRTFSNICNIGFGTIMQGSYLFGLVWCGFGILNGTLTYGTLTAVLQLINQIRSPFANISGYVPQYYSMLASAERLIEIEQLPKEHDSAAAPMSAFSMLHARDLSFIYDDGEEEVIQNASFDIERGEIVALTGISGIGKSTLLKLLLGIYAPTSGRLYLDCGKEETLIGPATRACFSYVPQGNMLMSGTIYEAVDFLHAAPYTRQQKERIERACQISCADEFIRRLPDGYDTVLGEKGAGLSEGQIQRIAIARAIYRDAPILLLDEATSALDEATEKRLLHNLKDLGDQTVLIVTHRPAALSICGKRLVFESAHITVET